MKRIVSLVILAVSIMVLFNSPNLQVNGQVTTLPTTTASATVTMNVTTTQTSTSVTVSTSTSNTIETSTVHFTTIQPTLTQSVTVTNTSTFRVSTTVSDVKVSSTTKIISFSTSTTVTNTTYTGSIQYLPQQVTLLIILVALVTVPLGILSLRASWNEKRKQKNNNGANLQ